MPTRAGAMQAERELERLYRRHRRDVYRSVLRDVRNPDEAEDVTQTAFLDAYRALQRGDEPVRPRAWLLTIAQNAARRRYRARAAAPREVELEAELLVAPGEPGPSADDIRQALDRLGRRQREALVLREIAGRSYVEIAAALDLSVPAVETLLFRARRALRKELSGWEPPCRARRALGGLLPWPLPTPLGDLIGSLSGWTARQGAAAKVAGALSAVAIGTGVAVESATTAAPDPAPAHAAVAEQTVRPLAAVRPAVRPARPAQERAPAAARPKKAKKAPGRSSRPESPAASPAALVEVPPVTVGPVALPAVTVPAVAELVPAPLPALPEVEAPELELDAP